MGVCREKEAFLTCLAPLKYRITLLAFEPARLLELFGKDPESSGIEKKDLLACSGVLSLDLFGFVLLPSRGEVKEQTIVVFSFKWIES